MRIGNIVFRGIMSPKDPLVLGMDKVLLVTNDYRVLDRAERYRNDGVQVHIYPLNILDSPTLFSLIGLLGWLYEESRKDLVLVEGYGQQTLLEKAYRLVFLGEGLDEIAPWELASPLHIRSLVHLDMLRRAGIDLVSEARDLVNHAFTGGDAHRSDVLELGLDIIFGLGEKLRLGRCINRLYQLARRSLHSGFEECILVYEAADSLDGYNVGAVKALALRERGTQVEAVIGCKLLLREDECWPEVYAAQPALRRLVDRLGLTLGSIEMTSPEEAACIAYYEYSREVCSDLEA